MSRDSWGEKCKFGVSVWMFVNILSSQLKKKKKKLSAFRRQGSVSRATRQRPGRTELHQAGQVHRPEVAV